MRKNATSFAARLPLILSALCLLLLALSFLPPAKDAVLAAGQTLKGSALRRPEKWFLLIRCALIACAACLAALQLLAALVRRAWCPLETEGQTLTSLFLSDANLLSVLLAAAVSVCLTFALKGRTGNMLFLLVQAFTFAASYFASCFCLMHNRHLRGKCRPAVQLAVLGAVLLWIAANFYPGSMGFLWHSTARIRLRYQMHPAFYALFLTLVSAAVCAAVKASDAPGLSGSRKFRLVTSLAYTCILSSLFFIPNIFYDDPYHINSWDASIFEVVRLAPYSADHFTAQYGHYGIIYLLPMRLLHLFGMPYNIAVASLQFLVAALMFLTVLYVMDQFIRNDAVFFLFLLALGVIFRFGHLAYFQQEPHRMVFGTVISAGLLLTERKGGLTRRRLAALCLLGAASVLWNAETGVVCLAAMSLYIFISARQKARGLLHAALFLSAGILIAWAVLNAYNLPCGGDLMGIRDLMFPLMEGSGFISKFEWPIVGVHSVAFAYFVLFMLSACFPVVAVFLPGRSGRAGESSLPSPQLHAAIAFMGLGFMAYYMAKCNLNFLNISYMQFLMVMAGIWGILEAGGHDGPRYPLVRSGRILILVLFSGLVMETIRLPERIQFKMRRSWRTEKLESFVKLLDGVLPDGIPGFGQDVTELYAYMDRDVKIHTTDWANLRFWKDSDSRPFEYVSAFLKDYDFFFANEGDVPLVPEAQKFRQLAAYKMGGQTFGIYAREGKSLDLCPFRGEGTLSSPYVIGGTDDLISLARHVNAGQDYEGAYFLQAADIDLSSVRNWMPVADGGMAFRGNYDGGGHVIEGLRIRKTRLLEDQGENPSLFGRLEGRVCNLGIGSGSVRGIDYAAAFASSGGKDAVIANCWNQADVHAFEASAGIAVDFGGTAACCVNFGRISKEFSLYGELEGICAHGEPVVWECRPMEGRDFDFAGTDALLEEAEGRFDLGGMHLIPWGEAGRGR